MKKIRYKNIKGKVYQNESDEMKPIEVHGEKGEYAGFYKSGTTGNDGATTSGEGIARMTLSLYDKVSKDGKIRKGTFMITTKVFSEDMATEIGIAMDMIQDKLGNVNIEVDYYDGVTTMSGAPASSTLVRIDYAGTYKHKTGSNKDKKNKQKK